jgi:hypothetical protein
MLTADEGVGFGLMILPFLALGLFVYTVKILALIISKILHKIIK